MTKYCTLDSKFAQLIYFMYVMTDSTSLVLHVKPDAHLHTIWSEILNITHR